MRRLTEVIGLIPVEYRTTRKVGATPQESAADINAAFSDPSVLADAREGRLAVAVAVVSDGRDGDASGPGECHPCALVLVAAALSGRSSQAGAGRWPR